MLKLAGKFKKEEAVEEAPMERGMGAEDGKVTPESARYMGPDMRCGNCKHFSDNACEIVSGSIDPEGVCVLHEMGESNMPMEMMDEESEEPEVEAEEDTDEEE